MDQIDLAKPQRAARGRPIVRASRGNSAAGRQGMVRPLPGSSTPLCARSKPAISSAALKQSSAQTPHNETIAIASDTFGRIFNLRAGLAVDS
jgi:hypothetical protein